MDETTVRAPASGRGRTKMGYMWRMVRDERPWSGADPPGVVYSYAPGRGGEQAENLGAGFSGTLQIDGYSGYNRLRRSDRPDGALTLTACWAHRRKPSFTRSMPSISPVRQRRRSRRKMSVGSVVCSAPSVRSIRSQ